MTSPTGSRTQEPSRPKDVIQWLRQGPSLAQMRAVFPEEWEKVEKDIAKVAAKGDKEELKAFLEAVTTPAPQSRGRARPKKAVLSEAVRRQMIVAALKQTSMAKSTGISRGKIRFNLVNGYVLQRLLFESGMRRKPAPLRTFNLLWPLLRQRKLLMPLVMQEGIYCFYSGRLVRSLSRIIGDRNAVEIAAGDGTLTRFLANTGTRITATDDYSWDRSVTYEDGDVTRMDAAKALRTMQPQVVVCSWPPPGNSFERHVFETGSVELYILITTRHEFAAGNWDAYRRQTAFEMVHDEKLSAMILPHEIDGAVYLFRRKPGR